MNPYETAISILTATPGTAECSQSRTDAANGTQHTWWRRALRSHAGRKVLAELSIPVSPEGTLPADWQAHPLVGPDDPRLEAALPVTVGVLREAVCPRAGVMFLERRGEAGRDGRRTELHLCAIDPEGTRAALMPVC